ncbi:helix-turn-helix transcriptional regulator [bacterium]|nr:helix-turn-helix transcriptional regulator [bacterium]
MNNNNQSFKDWFHNLEDEFKDDPRYALEDVLLDFSEMICKAMEEQGISKSELAKKMGKQPSWLSRILGAEHNLTFLTAVEIAMALGKEFKINWKPIKKLDSNDLIERIASYKKTIPNDSMNFLYSAGNEQSHCIMPDLERSNENLEKAA